MKKILITAPLRQDPRYFDEYRESVDKLIVPDGYEVETFYVVNNCDEIIPHLRKSDQWIVCDNPNDYAKTAGDHIWSNDNIQRVALFRNITIEFALNAGFDYWWSVDTDLVLHPMTLKALLDADKDIVSEIFWSKDPGGYEWCNAWMRDKYSGTEPQFKTPGLYQVGMTGACTLVKRKVLEAGVNYDFLPNLTIWGEDRHFSIRAAAHRFELWVDTHYPAWHLFTDEVYREYMRRKEEGSLWV